MDYKQSGVDISVGEELVRKIKPFARRTHIPGVLGNIGAFGGFFELSQTEFKHPVLVSSVDGVGTKLKIAVATKKYNTIGQCLVNHCVNDILVCGAKPLYFLDYYACGKLFPNVAADVIEGIAKACEENHCALIGGETAEMPGIYAEDDFDLAGTIVGVVEKEKIISGNSIQAGDVLIGLPSNGLHTNGYSLARKVLAELYQQSFSELGNKTVAEVLLQVHRSYFSLIYPMLSEFNLKGLSHITGGGIVGNTNRILPNGLELRVDWDAWKVPFIFELIQKKGNVPMEDMRKTFNLGIGLVLIVSKNEAEKVVTYLQKKNEKLFIFGEVFSSKN